MGWTLRISQKHVERFIFMLIILILVGILIADKLNLKVFNVNFESDIGVTTTTANVVISSSIAATTTTTLPRNSTTSITRFGTTTTSTTITNPAVPLGQLEFTVDKVYYRAIDNEKGVIDSIDVSIKNNDGSDYDLVLKYYLYDETSGAVERTTPKRPFIDVGVLGEGKAISKTYILNRTVFNIKYAKTLKFELEDEDAKIKKTVIQKITIN